MNILVTGGAGFIGSHVCDRLARDHRIICIDNFSDYYEPSFKRQNISKLLNNKQNFVLYKTDVTEFNSLKSIFKKNKIDKIIHLAACVGVRHSVSDPVLFENVLELERIFDVKKIIFTSSSSVYGLNEKIPFSEDDKTDNIVSPYAATKRCAEIMCQTYYNLYKIKSVCLRLFTVYGPRGRPDMSPYKFTKLVHEGKELPVYGDGNAKRDFTYVTDIVDGIVSALDKDINFDVINLGSGTPVKLSYLISLIEKNLDRRAKIKHMAEQLGDVPITYADISKAGKLLNYRPKVTIENGIKNFAAWFKNANRN